MNCGTISVSNILTDHHLCEQCKREKTLLDRMKPDNELKELKLQFTHFVFDWYFERDRIYVLGNKLYICPICKTENLQFVNNGNWD